MPNSLCVVENCDKITTAKQMCQQHYDRKRRYGDVYTRPKHLICQDCEVTFEVRLFGSLPEICIPCAEKRHRAKTLSDRWRKGLWEYYKITPADYQVMFDSQNGRCLICSGGPDGRGKKNKRLNVDHNHTTGKIRGLLCSKCNTGLGLFNDSENFLSSAIQYLKERD
jgi:hypothetical protein